tara:strand:+ start:1980 stop:2327 length:348 start_codon:yes stop_codon:yes gene_type:complete
MASKFLPAVAGLASRAMPYLSSAFAVGKRVLPQVIGAVGKAQHMAQQASAVGKSLHNVGSAIAPELTKKVENAYNSKIIGNNSIGDILEKGQKGLATAVGVADKAKELLANMPPT